MYTGTGALAGRWGPMMGPGESYVQMTHLQFVLRM